MFDGSRNEEADAGIETLCVGLMGIDDLVELDRIVARP